MPISHCPRIYLFAQWPRVTTSIQLSPVGRVWTPEPWHNKGETTAWPLVHFQTLCYFTVYMTILLSQPNARLKQEEGEIKRFHWLWCECCILWDQLLNISLTLGYYCEFSGAPVVRTPCFYFWGHRFNPWWGNRDPTSLVACSHPQKMILLTWLSYFTFTFHFYALEKEMATRSSVLAWRIPGMGSHSRTGLKWLSSSSSSTVQHACLATELLVNNLSLFKLSLGVICLLHPICWMPFLSSITEHSLFPFQDQMKRHEMHTRKESCHLPK